MTVEKIMARRRNGATNAKEIYALSGRIFCECGAAMSGTRIGARGNKYIYYACSNQKINMVIVTFLWCAKTK